MVMAVFVPHLGAADPPPPAGRLMAASCFQCHAGPASKGRGFESITGEGASELYRELLEMKRRKEVDSIMDLQARGYSDQQLLAISTYLASLGGGDEDDDD